MGRELPDVVFDFFMMNWENLGLNPVILFRLLERGLSHDEIEFAMSTLVGPDWKQVKVTGWLNRLETAGLIAIPSVGDTQPVADLLAEIIRVFNRNMCGYCTWAGLMRSTAYSPKSLILFRLMWKKALCLKRLSD